MQWLRSGLGLLRSNPSGRLQEEQNKAHLDDALMLWAEDTFAVVSCAWNASACSFY
jgi:hypothetical protein